MSDAIPQYEIINLKTGLVEAGPYPPDEARDKLVETREKLKAETEDSHLYIPVVLKLRRVDDTENEKMNDTIPQAEVEEALEKADEELDSAALHGKRDQALFWAARKKAYKELLEGTDDE